jgi:hypothetical protein
MAQFLTPTDVEPTVAVALSTATGEPAEAEELASIAEPTGTAEPTQAPTETPEPTNTARPNTFAACLRPKTETQVNGRLDAVDVTAAQMLSHLPLCFILW